VPTTETVFFAASFEGLFDLGIAGFVERSRGEPGVSEA